MNSKIDAISSIRFSIGPASSTRHFANDLCGFGVAVFDPLCLVQNNQIEFRFFVLGHLLHVAHEDFVIDDPDRNVGHRPDQLAAIRVAFHSDNWKLLRPRPKLALPVRDEWFRADKQDRPDAGTTQQKPHGRNRLHRFAEPHLVGQQRRLLREQPADSLVLMRKRLKRHDEFLPGEHRLQRWLQDVKQPILKRQRIIRRSKSRWLSLFPFRLAIAVATYLRLFRADHGQSSVGLIFDRQELHGIGKRQADRPHARPRWPPRRHHANRNRGSDFATLDRRPAPQRTIPARRKDFGRQVE